MEELPVETTLYSLSPAPPAMAAERRDGDRHLTLFRVGSVNLGDRRELCLIKNISAGGMMIRAYCAIAQGERLTVELKSGQPIAGAVSWVREQTLGVAFDQPIDVIDILSSSMEGPRPRMPRIEVDCYATVREGASTYHMRVCDVSQGGIKVTSSVILSKGADIVVTLPGLPALPGVMRWMEEGFGGITFNRLLPLSELVGWLQGMRGNLRAVG